ncbi:ribosomal RNA small subunit methyltransferase A [Candidatus Uhrbacteria bacterium]|nr:ribosomal RNA small subunit methyltransferase A [Candidatus Uhrbacteria bacterium]
MTREELHAQLKKIGLRPARVRGQNFLIDDGVLRDIVEAAELTRDDRVLEIGPGLGILTKELVKRCGCVAAVEIDSQLVGHLVAAVSEPNFHLVEGDVRSFTVAELARLCGGSFTKLVANIPYHITSEVLEKFLEDPLAPPLLVLLVQQEVARRITARPPNLSRLGVFIQYLGKPEIARMVGRQSFFPPPRVTSAVVRLRKNPADALARRERRVSRSDFFRLVRSGFSAPRRKLLGNLSRGLGYSKEMMSQALVKAGLSLDLRAEALSLDDWIRLSQMIFETGFGKKNSGISGV